MKRREARLGDEVIYYPDEGTQITHDLPAKLRGEIIDIGGDWILIDTKLVMIDVQPSQDRVVLVEKAIPNPDDVDEIYEMWHQKKPNRRVRVQNKLLDEPNAVSIGKAKKILYRSAKWEKDQHLYDHDFTSSPNVYTVESKAHPDDRVGRTKSIRSLLGIRGTKNSLSLPQLGTVEELVIVNRDGEEVSVPVGRSPRLLSTADKKGLLILASRAPIFIRGGAMSVTKRGIVK